MLAPKPEDLSLVPRINMVEGENQHLHTGLRREAAVRTLKEQERKVTNRMRKMAGPGQSRMRLSPVSNSVK